MKSPNPNEAGALAFALASATLEKLVAKGILTRTDECAVLIAARDSFAGSTIGTFQRAHDWLSKAVIVHPESK